MIEIERNKKEGIFMEGYRAGFLDGLAAKDRDFPKDLDLPVEALELTVRPLNCLRVQGCRRVGEVANLDRDAILRMRNLGAKSADEIARALHRFRIFGTPWDAFLKK